MTTHEIRQHEHTDPVTGQKFLVTDEIVSFDEQEYIKLARAMAGIRTAYLYDIDPLAPPPAT